MMYKLSWLSTDTMEVVDLDLEHEGRLAKVEERAKSNTHRLDKLEETTAVIHRIASSVERLADKQETVAESVEKLDGKVTALEQKPGKRWDSIVEKAIWAVVAAVIAFLLGKVGL